MTHQKLYVQVLSFARKQEHIKFRIGCELKSFGVAQQKILLVDDYIP